MIFRRSSLRPEPIKVLLEKHAALWNIVITARYRRVKQEVLMHLIQNMPSVLFFMVGRSMYGA